MTIREWLVSASPDEIEESLMVERKRVIELEAQVAALAGALEWVYDTTDEAKVRDKARTLLGRSGVERLVARQRALEHVAAMARRIPIASTDPDEDERNLDAAIDALDMFTGYAEQAGSAPEVPDSHST